MVQMWSVKPAAMAGVRCNHRLGAIRFFTALLLVSSYTTKRWLQRTPAMAAGLTDHIWTMDELLSFRVPPRFVWSSIAKSPKLWRASLKGH